MICKHCTSHIDLYDNEWLSDHKVFPRFCYGTWTRHQPLYDGQAIATRHIQANERSETIVPERSQSQLDTQVGKVG